MAQLALLERSHQYLRMETPDSAVVSLLALRDSAAFERVFKAHYKNMHAYAIAIVRDEAAAEEIVQNIFFKLWNRAGSLVIKGSIAAYLYTAVHHESLNVIKHQKIRTMHKAHVMHQGGDSTGSAADSIAAKELEEQFHSALNELPEQCRTIFQLSRFQELKYREIADELGLSVKTVENQMGKALKILREKLKDFLPLTLILLSNF